MYDEKYYEEKKIKLERKLLLMKDRVIQDCTKVFNEFWGEVKELQGEFKEVADMQEQSKKSTEEKHDKGKKGKEDSADK